MKKLFSFSILTLVLSFSVKAQIPNAGFESINPDSTLQHWFSMNAWSIGLNDSFLNDGLLNGWSTQAHSGTKALELRNMYNVTQSTAMNGNVTCYADSSFAGFNSNFSISNKPYALNFYYQFTQNPYMDTTECVVKIMNSDYTLIGQGQYKFWTVNGSYQQVSLPIQYLDSIPSGQGDSIPAFANIKFQNIVTAGPHVGQRVLIDDLTFVNQPLSTPLVEKTIDLQLYPNPVIDKLHIRSINGKVGTCLIYDVLGHRLMKQEEGTDLDMSALPSGIYMATVFVNGLPYHRSLIKR